VGPRGGGPVPQQGDLPPARPQHPLEPSGLADLHGQQQIVFPDTEVGDVGARWPGGRSDPAPAPGPCEGRGDRRACRCWPPGRRRRKASPHCAPAGRRRRCGRYCPGRRTTPARPGANPGCESCRGGRGAPPSGRATIEPGPGGCRNRSGCTDLRGWVGLACRRSRLRPKRRSEECTLSPSQAGPFAQPRHAIDLRSLGAPDFAETD
jgi:hypothetical protein